MKPFFHLTGRTHLRTYPGWREWARACLGLLAIGAISDAPFLTRRVRDIHRVYKFKPKPVPLIRAFTVRRGPSPRHSAQLLYAVRGSRIPIATLPAG